MCGIGGAIVLEDGARPVTAGELLRMGARMPWRGPDDEGYLLETRAGRREPADSDGSRELLPRPGGGRHRERAEAVCTRGLQAGVEP